MNNYNIKSLIFNPLSIIVIIMGLAISCKSDNEEERFGVSDFICDSTVTFSSVIQPIINTSCAITGCHVPGTGRANFLNFNEIQNNAAGIKSRTQSRDMPRIGSLTQLQIDQIGCWVDEGALNN